MQTAIVTTFRNDEDHRPGVGAECMGKHVWLPYDSSLSLDDNHVLAAAKLAERLGWRREWTYGRLPLGDYCHVAVNPVRRYSTEPVPGASSPPEQWRARGGGSLPSPRRR